MRKFKQKVIKYKHLTKKEWMQTNEVSKNSRGVSRLTLEDLYEVKEGKKDGNGISK